MKSGNIEVIATVLTALERNLDIVLQSADNEITALKPMAEARGVPIECLASHLEALHGLSYFLHHEIAEINAEVDGAIERARA